VAQILDKAIDLAAASLFVRGAQQCRGMHCGERARRQRKGNEPAAARVTRKAFPKRAWAAVAPSATTICGLTTLISASSHGKQASISTAPGLL